MMCKTCENLDNNANGLYCMVANCSCSPMLENIYCPSYEPTTEVLKQLKTVKWVLHSLNLLYAHVVVRKKTQNGVVCLGGGNTSQVIRRFGDCAVLHSSIVDGVLIVFVR